MFFDPNERIAGCRSFQIKRILKKGNQGSLNIGLISNLLNIDESQSIKIIQELKNLNLIVEKYSDKEITFWETTNEGRRLSMASSRNPITRSTADRLVSEFLDRVKIVNNDPSYLSKITKVIVFGSYLTDVERLNDVDIGIFMERKMDNEEFMRLSDEKIMRLKNEGKKFRSYLDELSWPDTEIFKFLKHRSNAISLHHDDKVFDHTEIKVIFNE